MLCDKLLLEGGDGTARGLPSWQDVGAQVDLAINVTEA